MRGKVSIRTPVGGWVSEGQGVESLYWCIGLLE